jgi:hypothetical protein
MDSKSFAVGTHRSLALLLEPIKKQAATNPTLHIVQVIRVTAPMFEQVLLERAGPTGGHIVLPEGARPRRCMTVIHKLSTPS